MKNALKIADLGDNLSKAGEMIAKLASGLSDEEDNQNLVSAYSSAILNELENVQHFVLNLTALVTEAIAPDQVNHEDSMFFAGELNDDLGTKTDEAVDYVDPEEEDK